MRGRKKRGKRLGVEAQFRGSGGVGGQQDELVLPEIRNPDLRGKLGRQEGRTTSRKCIDLERFFDDRFETALGCQVTL